jgi:hypothetical protein
MTVTKYFKDGNTGLTAMAFSTWGLRVSLNVEILKPMQSLLGMFLNLTYEPTYDPKFMTFGISKKTI